MNPNNLALPVSCWQLLAIAAVFNAILPGALTHLHEMSVTEALLSGLGQSHVIWIALLISLMLAPALSIPRLAQDWQNEPAKWLFMTVSLLLVIPLASLSWLLAALAAFIWLRRLPRHHRGRAAPVLICALAMRDPLTQSLLLLFSEQILNFDSVLAAKLIRTTNQEVTLAGNILVPAGSHGLLILTGCSAFGNLSHALLLWLSLMLWRNQTICPADTLRILLLCVLVIGTNSVRLALMSQSSELYSIIHDGWGSPLFDSLVLLIPLLLTRWRTHHVQSYSADKPAVS